MYGCTRAREAVLKKWVFLNGIARLNNLDLFGFAKESS